MALCESEKWTPSLELAQNSGRSARLPLCAVEVHIRYSLLPEPTSLYKKIKQSNHLNRLVTLSPLTDMATKFHSGNGAKLLQVNETTQNFEYKIIK